MRHLAKLGTFIALTLILSSCGGKKVAFDEAQKVKKEGVAVWTNWLKDKGKKFDLQFNIQNEGKKDIIILLSDMSCFHGSVAGTLKHTFFNTGERTIDIHPGQLKSFNLVCNMGGESQGDYKILISRVYENPNGDGKTRGKAIVNDLEWKGKAE